MYVFIQVLNELDVKDQINQTACSTNNYFTNNDGCRGSTVNSMESHSAYITGCGCSLTPISRTLLFRYSYDESPVDKKLKYELLSTQCKLNSGHIYCKLLSRARGVVYVKHCDDIFNYTCM